MYINIYYDLSMGNVWVTKNMIFKNDMCSVNYIFDTLFFIRHFFAIMIRCKTRFGVFGPFSKIAIMMKRHFVDLSQYTHCVFSSYESRSSWWIVVFLKSMRSECVRRHARDETFVYSHPDTRADDERDAVIDRMINTDDVFWDCWRTVTKRNPTGPETRNVLPGDVDIFSRHDNYFTIIDSIIFKYSIIVIMEIDTSPVYWRWFCSHAIERLVNYGDILSFVCKNEEGTHVVGTFFHYLCYRQEYVRRGYRVQNFEVQWISERSLLSRSGLFQSRRISSTVL